MKRILFVSVLIAALSASGQLNPTPHMKTIINTADTAAELRTLNDIPGLPSANLFTGANTMTNPANVFGGDGSRLLGLTLGFSVMTNSAASVTNALGAVPVIDALHAASSDALGGFTASAFALTTNLNVATSGSDTNNGSVSAPLATITNAIRRLNGNGTIYVRGGLYHNQDINLTNAENIRIVNYRDEYPEFWFGEGITPASFTLVSNGIYSATMPVAFSNALQRLETFWDAWSPLNRGIYLHQTNAPYGPNVAGSYFVPPLIDIKSETNRCEHTPLRQAASVTSMTHSNHYWFQEGPLLYVKFAVSNVPGGIYISSTNYTGGKAAVHSGSAKTRVYMEGIKTYFGGHGFDVSGCASWEFKSCLSYGAGYNAFHYNSESYPEPGGGKLSFCEGSGYNGFGFNGQGTIANTRMINIVEERCYWHDYLREASTVRENVSRIVTGSVAFAGRNGQFGFIDQGTSSLYIGCTSISNSIAGWQLGTATSLGRPSFQDIRGCRMIEDLVAIQLNDFNCIVNAYGNYFNPNAAGGYINVAENPESHFVRQGGNFGTVASSGIFINGTGVSSNPTRYINDPAYVGTSGSTLRVGNLQMAGADTIAGYGIHMTGFKVKVTGVAEFSAGAITNGNAVWFDRTNTAPPASLNRVWMATDTNAPTTIFVGNNGSWVEK